MNYEDEQIIQNFEKLAKEYTNSLQKKGFVFVRLKDEDENKKTLIQTISELLVVLKSEYEKALKFARKKSLVSFFQTLNQMTTAFEFEFKTLYPTANSSKQQKVSIKQLDAEIFMANESKLLKALFELFNLEDDMEKHLFLKRTILSRLDFLSKTPT